jgi:acyl carrier protein
MSDDDVFVFLRTQLRTIRPALPAAWPVQAHYKHELGLDSLDLVELAARIEQRYKLMIPDADLPGFVSLEATKHYILARVSP